MARTRSSNKQFLALLASSSRPIYAIDDRRQIVYCNEACAAWLGVDAKELLGRQCDYHAGDVSTDELAAALCPPPQAFYGTPVSVHVTCRDTSGAAARRAVQFYPLASNSEDAGGVLALLSPTDSPPVDPNQEPAITASDLHDRLRVQTQRIRRHYRVDRLVGDSPEIRRVRAQVQVAIASQSSVSVVGPPGSGREQLARTIHCGADPGSAGPLMPLSSSSLDAELLQTTLAAFLARCREADAQGSASVLFLDADQLTPTCQAELSSFLRQPSFVLRTMITARRPLSEVAAEDGFDHGLALALSTLVISVPPLASRRQDIPILAQQFVEGHNTAGKKQLSGFTVEALDKLGSLPWTRDMDELAQVVEEAWQASEGPWISETDLPRSVALTTSAAAYPVQQDPVVPLDDFLVEIESELIQRAMNRAQGNKAQAARLLGIHRARLLRRLAQLESTGSQPSS